MMRIEKNAVLRTQLRALNMEYSALVRAAGSEADSVRMSELRTRRHALMALIAETNRFSQQNVPQTFPVQEPVIAAVEHVAA
jgi:hypothetical protein